MNTTDIAFVIGSLFRRGPSSILYRACLGLVLLTSVARIEVARADFLYVGNLGTQTAGASIDVYSVDANHTLTWSQTVPFPVQGLLVAGTTLYATSGSGKVGEFAIDTTTGRLTLRRTVAVGSDPRGMASDGRTLFVANHGSNSVSVLAIDSATGKLNLIQKVTGVGAPDGLAILDTSPKILVTSGADVCTFRIKPAVSLKLLRCSPSGHLASQPPPSIAALGQLVYFTQYTVTGFGIPTSVGAFTINPTTGIHAPVAQIPFGFIVLYRLAASPVDNLVFLARNGGISTLSPATNLPFRELAFSQLPALAVNLIADPKGKTLYAASPSQNQIFSLSLSTGGGLSVIQTEAGTAGGFPFCLALMDKPLMATNAFLTVKKVLIPAIDPGRFNLQIDSVTKATNVGNGGSTGSVVVPQGTHTITESSNVTSLSSYTRTFGGDCNAAGVVTLAAGDHKTCIITNSRIGPPASCVRACEAAERQCMLQAHSSAERQECIREKNQCVHQCSP